MIWIDGVLHITGAFDKQRVAGFGGFDYARKVSVSTIPNFANAGAYVEPFLYFFEGYDASYLKNKTATLQFWFDSNVSGTFSISFLAGDVSQSYVTDFSFNTPGTPQKITKTINIPASVITNTTNGRGFMVIIGAIAEATYATSTTDSWVSGTYDSSLARTNWMNTVGNYISITGVQLEIGDAATDFEFRPFAEELALCQRYYEQGQFSGNNSGGAGGSTRNTHRCNEKFKVVKRVVPTLQIANFVMYDVTAAFDGRTDLSIYGINFIGTDVSIGFSRMSFDWTADAEL